MLKNKLKNKKKGFTLIELIVVLAVLAIIALIAIPNFNQIRENSKIKSDQRSADLIDKAVTTLVLDGSIGNAVYTYKDSTLKVVTESDKAPGKGPESDYVKVESILDPAKVQQDHKSDAKEIYTITIIDANTKDPKVVVTVGDYTTASPTA